MSIMLIPPRISKGLRAGGHEYVPVDRPTAVWVAFTQLVGVVRKEAIAVYVEYRKSYALPSTCRTLELGEKI